MDMNTGDLLLYQGNGLFSTIIMLAPGAKYSHVGHYVDHPDYGPCVFESTSLGTLPDVITGELICGVQLVPFQERVDSYDGDVFHLPILGERSEEQIHAGLDFIDEHHGTPYEEDNVELVRSELDILPWHRNKPDPSTLFCSETSVMFLRNAKFIEDDGTPANEYTPTDCANLVLTDGFTFGDVEEI